MHHGHLDLGPLETAPEVRECTIAFPLGRARDEGFRLLQDRLRGLPAEARNDVPGLEFAEFGPGDDDPSLDPVNGDRKPRSTRRFVRSVDRGVSVVERRGEALQDRAKVFLLPRLERLLERFREDAVPIVIDDVKIWIEVLKHVPGDDRCRKPFVEEARREGIEGALQVCPVVCVDPTPVSSFGITVERHGNLRPQAPRQRRRGDLSHLRNHFEEPVRGAARPRGDERAATPLVAACFLQTE